MVDAYKRVVAGRFSERALVLPAVGRVTGGRNSHGGVVPGPGQRRERRGSCTRAIPTSQTMTALDHCDPRARAGHCQWAGSSRPVCGGPPSLSSTIEQSIVHKEEEIVLREGGGLERRSLDSGSRPARRASARKNWRCWPSGACGLRSISRPRRTSNGRSTRPAISGSFNPGRS